MNNRIEQDELEWRCIKSFKDAYASFPEGEIKKSEKPDFIIYGNRKIGIEHSYLFRGDGKDIFSIQRQDQFKNIIVEGASQKIKETSVKQFNVFVSFEEKTKIEPANIVTLIDFLVEKVVSAKNPTKERQVTIGKYYLEPYQDTFSMIQLYDFGDIHPLWKRMDVFSVESIEKNGYLEKLIGQKNKKHYAGCDELWLLITIDYFNPSSQQYIPKDFKVNVKESMFDSIFFNIAQTKEVYKVYEKRTNN